MGNYITKPEDPDVISRRYVQRLAVYLSTVTLTDLQTVPISLILMILACTSESGSFGEPCLDIVDDIHLRP